MKFPITRERLQAFDYAKEQAELLEEEFQKQLKAHLDGMCQQFKQEMISNSKEKKFVWRLRGSGSYQGRDYIPIFINKLKEVFIGCDIITDPLKTYLIIDWS